MSRPTQIFSEQYQKGEMFKRLHTESGPFVIPNPWDKGTAKMMEAAGFKALATTSAGLAFSLGKLDRFSSVSVEETLNNTRDIVSASSLPVSVDLEDGFGKTYQEIQKTYLAAAEAGAVGGSIEDYSGNPASPILEFSLAVERVEAAADAVRKMSIPFTLTARAENFLYGVTDLQDTISRLKTFAAAGADVLYAPALPDAESIRAVCQSVNCPVNVLLGSGNTLSVQELFNLGVTRVSLGSTLSRAAFGGFIRALQEVQESGSCDFLKEAVSYSEMNQHMQKSLY